MDIITFRAVVEKLLRGKSKELQSRVKHKILDIQKLVQREYLSDETVTIIIMTQEMELERANNEK